MNVTLGVPRLRELLMVGSVNVKTPTMEVPILCSSSALRKAKHLQRRWSRLVFSQVLTHLKIEDKLTLTLNEQHRTCVVEFHFDQTYGKKHRNEILRSFETFFVPHLCRAINKKRKELSTSGLLRSAHIRDKQSANDDNDKDESGMRHDDDNDDDDDDEDDEAHTEQHTGEANRDKEKANRNDQREYDDGENDNENDKDDDDDDDMPLKVKIKEDIIDDDDAVQGRSCVRVRVFDRRDLLVRCSLDMDTDDERKVPVDDDDDDGHDEPARKKRRTSSATQPVHNERFIVSRRSSSKSKSLLFLH
jgi:hypothetical protein